MADKGTKILPGLRDAARAVVDNLVADKGTKILPGLRDSACSGGQSLWQTRTIWKCSLVTDKGPEM